MVTPIDASSAAFLLAENRRMPMHVAGLQLFEKPDGVEPDYVRRMYEQMRDTTDVRPIFLKHPHRSVRTAGQLVWRPDEAFDPEHHVRHSALPEPGRIRELLDLCGRLHSTRLAWERPLWEAHIIEGLADGRVALYTKVHHALVDGVAATRLLADSMSKDPDERDMLPSWGRRPNAPSRVAEKAADAPGLADLPVEVVRTALGLAAEAAGMPAALARTMVKGLRNETSAVSLFAPRTIFNQPITGSRRFAAQDWPIERLKAIGKASGTTINDVVIAMCAGALRAYLLEHDALPEAPLVAMVPVALKARQSASADDGGNAVGAVMCQMATDKHDPAERLRRIHASMVDGKEALQTMTPAQIVAMSALGQAPAIVAPLLRLGGVVRPPYNVIISNVPGPSTTRYWNGSKLVGSYPLSIPINGMALNITCTSYDGKMGFGLIGCRRTVPHLQRMLQFLDDEVAALEKAVGA